MSKLPLRIVLPSMAAVATAAGILLFLWWQAQSSASRVKQELLQVTNIMERIHGSILTTDISLTGGDAALLHVRKGDLASLQGDWKAAEEEYQESVNADGGLSALRKLAHAQLQRRQYDDLRDTIRKLEREGAQKEDIILLQTLLLLRTGELTAVEELLGVSDETPQQHYGLGLLAIIQGNHDQAKTELEKVSQGWDPVLRSYASVLLEAYREYELFPKSPGSHRTALVARALAEVQECDLALPLLTEVIQEQPDYRDAWVVQGYCELITERTAQALISFERAYSIDPEKPEIQYFLGRAHAALGDNGNALTFLQYALKNGFQPEAEVRRRIATSALQTGNDAVALAQYKALLEAENADLTAYETFISMALSIGEKEEALSRAQEAAARWPEEARAHELLGWTFLELDRKDEGRAALTKALELDPNLTSAKKRLDSL